MQPRQTSSKYNSIYLQLKWKISETWNYHWKMASIKYTVEPVRTEKFICFYSLWSVLQLSIVTCIANYIESSRNQSNQCTLEATNWLGSTAHRCWISFFTAPWSVIFFRFRFTNVYSLSSNATVKPATCFRAWCKTKARQPVLAWRSPQASKASTPISAASWRGMGNAAVSLSRNSTIRCCGISAARTKHKLAAWQGLTHLLAPLGRCG